MVGAPPTSRHPRRRWRPGRGPPGQRGTTPGAPSVACQAAGADVVAVGCGRLRSARRAPRRSSWLGACRALPEHALGPSGPRGPSDGWHSGPVSRSDSSTLRRGGRPRDRTMRQSRVAADPQILPATVLFIAPGPRPLPGTQEGGVARARPGLSKSVTPDVGGSSASSMRVASSPRRTAGPRRDIALDRWATQGPAARSTMATAVRPPWINGSWRAGCSG